MRTHRRRVLLDLAVLNSQSDHVRLSRIIELLSGVCRCLSDQTATLESLNSIPMIASAISCCEHSGCAARRGVMA